jgi:hypothetical protein
MRRRSLVLLALGGITVGLVGVGAYARPLLETGTGYAAHNACAVTFLAGRGAAAADDDLPPNPLVPLLRTTVDDGERSARSSVLGVLFGQTAWHTPGLGCALADERPSLEAPAPVEADGWPVVALDERLDTAVDRAFGAADGEPLGTRAVVVLADGRLGRRALRRRLRRGHPPARVVDGQERHQRDGRTARRRGRAGPGRRRPAAAWRATLAATSPSRTCCG